ncbi:MAG: hypothetical protein NTV54_05245 [Ignavibacteriales bacterium]|nr:hypothetical protein [Ignavibacteriales bacterium]
MKLGMFQYAPLWEDRQRSRELIAATLPKTGEVTGIDWLIFPEMTLSGFTQNKSRSTLDESDIAYFSRLAVDYNAAVTYGGVVNGKNVSVTIDRHGVQLARYEKIHLFTYANEHESYRPGNTVTDFHLAGFRIRPVVCYDLRFGYLFWEKASDIDAFVVIANWPEVRAHHWRSLLTARAIENQAYVIGVNRVGADPLGNYAGDSCVIDPMGAPLLQCRDGSGLFITEIDPARVCEVRTKYPFLKDRKTMSLPGFRCNTTRNKEKQ